MSTFILRFVLAIIIALVSANFVTGLYSDVGKTLHKIVQTVQEAK